MSFSCLGLFKGAKARHFSNKEIPKIPDSIVLRYWMLIEFPLIFYTFSDLFVQKIVFIISIPIAAYIFLALTQALDSGLG